MGTERAAVASLTLAAPVLLFHHCFPAAALCWVVESLEYSNRDEAANTRDSTVVCLIEGLVARKKVQLS